MKKITVDIFLMLSDAMRKGAKPFFTPEGEAFIAGFLGENKIQVWTNGEEKTEKAGA